MLGEMLGLSPYAPVELTLYSELNSNDLPWEVDQFRALPQITKAKH